MRSFVHYGLSALLAIVSIGAPFAHTHEPAKAEEHLAQEHFSELHAHIVLLGDDPALSEADHSARRVNWFRFQLEQPLDLAPPRAERRLLAPPTEAEGGAELASEALPEQPPPRLAAPRGPPILFA